jgi:hypothetical protein
MPGLGHEHFLPDPFQIIVHLSPYNLTLYDSDTESVVRYPQGRAIAHAVCRRIPTAAARVLSQVRSWGIFGWTKWHCGRFSPSISVSPTNSHSTDCSTFVIYHPGLVQYVKMVADATIRLILTPPEEDIHKEPSNQFRDRTHLHGAV